MVLVDRAYSCVCYGCWVYSLIATYLDVVTEVLRSRRIAFLRLHYYVRVTEQFWSAVWFRLDGGGMVIALLRQKRLTDTMYRSTTGAYRSSHHLKYTHDSAALFDSCVVTLSESGHLG